MLLRSIKKILLPIKGVSRQLLRILINSPKIKKFDALLPLKGSISESGYIQSSLSNKSVEILNDYEFNDSLTLNSELSFVLNEIFDHILVDVNKYLGENIRIDGIKFLTTNKSTVKSISHNWHTDNVGNRLKVFACFEGDGSQPTAIIQDSHRKTYGYNKFTIEELLRWAHIKNISKKSGEVLLKHSRGTIFVFDNNSFHRGCYEQTVNQRKVLLLELVNKEKSKYLMKFTSLPIGPNITNSFFIDEDFKKQFTYSHLLDQDLIYREDTREHYGDKKFSIR